MSRAHAFAPAHYIPPTVDSHHCPRRAKIRSNPLYVPGACHCHIWAGRYEWTRGGITPPPPALIHDLFPSSRASLLSHALLLLQMRHSIFRKLTEIASGESIHVGSVHKAYTPHCEFWFHKKQTLDRRWTRGNLMNALSSRLLRYIYSALLCQLYNRRYFELSLARFSRSLISWIAAMRTNKHNIVSEKMLNKLLISRSIINLAYIYYNV